MIKVLNDMIITSKKAPRVASIRKHEEHHPTKRHSLKKPIKVKLIVWFFILLCLAALFFSVSMVFTKATVKITPKTEVINLNNETFIATLKTTSAQDFPFEVVSINKTTYKSVEATGEKQVESKAVGKVMIYNSYNTSEQKLASGTRLSLEDGRIFRLNELVTVPGLKNVNGKDVPGKVAVNITADKVGEKYNIKASDLKENFKIVGFKGTDKEKGFYATLTEDTVGGFNGLKNTLTAEKEIELNKELQNDLEKLLLSDYEKAKSKSYLSLDNLNYVKYSLLSQENDGSRVKVGMQASLKAITFNTNKLATYLATKKISDFNKLAVDIIIPDDFVIKILSTSTEPWLQKNLEISLTGKPTIVWKYNPEDIKKALVGKSSSELTKIQDKYQDSISNLEAHFSPPWQIFFPDDISKIKMEE